MPPLSSVCASPPWLQYLLIKPAKFCRWWTSMSWQTPCPLLTHPLPLLSLHPFAFVNVTWRDSFVNNRPRAASFVCLPQPPDPSLLLSHQCQQRWRGCCACLTRRKLKNLEMNLSTAKVHTGATLLSAQGMAVKVSSFTPLLMWHPGAQGAYPGQGGLRGILSLENILSCCSLSILNVSIFIIVCILFLLLSLTHYKDYCPVRDNKELYYCCDKFHTRGA